MLYAIYTNRKVDWCSYIYSKWVSLVKDFKMEMLGGKVNPKHGACFGLRILAVLKYFKIQYQGKELLKSMFVGKVENMGRKEGIWRKTRTKLVKKQTKKKKLLSPARKPVSKSSSDSEEQEVPVPAGNEKILDTMTSRSRRMLKRIGRSSLTKKARIEKEVSDVGDPEIAEMHKILDSVYNEEVAAGPSQVDKEMGKEDEVQEMEDMQNSIDDEKVYAAGTSRIDEDESEEDIDDATWELLQQQRK